MPPTTTNAIDALERTVSDRQDRTDARVDRIENTQTETARMVTDIRLTLAKAEGSSALTRWAAPIGISIALGFLFHFWK